MLTTVKVTPDGVRDTGPGVPTDGERVFPRVTRTPSAYRLSRELPASAAVYYRVGRGLLEWSDNLSDFLPNGTAVPDAGALLALVHGLAPAPDSVPAPEVHRLPVGGSIQVDADGVTVTRGQPKLAPGPRRLIDAVGRALQDHTDGYAIAYSGGLGSAFVAAAALAAGHRPVLLHADLGLPGRQPPAAVPGLRTRSVRLDPSELLDHHWITGAEPAPVLPDREVRLRLTACLGGDAGRLVGGSLLKDLVAVKLPDIDAGTRGWRLLRCEPFHLAGTLGTLASAREMLGNRIVYRPGQAAEPGPAPDAQPVGAPPPPSPTDGSRLPWLTAAGRQHLEIAQRGGMAVWQEYLDRVDPVLGRLTAGLEERGDGGMLLPALDSRVLTTVAAIRPSRLGRVHRAVFENHLPLRRPVRAAGIVGTREASTGFWLRLAAVEHLRRERDKIIAELDRGCALADQGLVDARALTRNLRDGRDIAEHAMPLLRLVWLDRWLRGRA